MLWIGVAVAAEQFDPGGDFSQRPFSLVVGLLGACFTIYLLSLALVWNAPEGKRTARRQWRAVLVFAVLFRLALWWSQPIQELDLYRYLWDGRVLVEGINPYRYAPAQVDAARAGNSPAPDLAKLADLLSRSPEVVAIFSLIDRRSVPTIYPPLSEAVFGLAAFITPERAPVRVQLGIFKGLLLIFDLVTVLLITGLLQNFNQPPARALAYAWCPLVLKEFANTGHLDAIAVCLTAAMFWVLTLPFEARGVSFPRRWRDGLATVLWGASILAKLYPIVLAPVLLTFWWRRSRWRTGAHFATALLVVIAGYALLPSAVKERRTNTATGTAHSSFSGLGEFLRRWEMNDLLFSVVYENTRQRSPDHSKHEPWYSVVSGAAREQMNRAMVKVASMAGLAVPSDRTAFLFTQSLVAGILLSVAGLLASRRWPDDPREALVRRSFLCLVWLWFLSATQNPWYWTWGLPLVALASRAWLLVSGFALLYYLRFWFVYQFPDATLPGGLTGMRFFDEVVIWFEHGLPLCAVALAACLTRKRFQPRVAIRSPAPSPAHPGNVIVVIPALNEEASLPRVIERLRRAGLERIRVVDNGSRDLTAEVARHFGAEVIVERRRGYGQACWTGCQSLPSDSQWILFCNADGSDDIERVSLLLGATTEGAELVLGQRVAGQGGRDHLTLPQRFGNRLAVSLIRLLWGARHGDLGPLRLISHQAFEELHMRDRGFGWTVEMQVRAVETGLPVVEIAVRNFARTAGVTKISGTIAGSLHAGAVILSTIVRLWWRASDSIGKLSRT